MEGRGMKIRWNRRWMERSGRGKRRERKGTSRKE